jgi:hypothetical protein
MIDTVDPDPANTGAAATGAVIDPGDLARALGHEVGEFTVEAIDPARRLHSVTGGVYRVKAEDHSLIIKVVRRGVDDDPDGLWVSGEQPAHRNYWKREWLAFQTGLLDALPGELRAPRTLLTTQVADDECWIWMEDVEGRPGAGWAVEDYDSATFDLATTQAAYASGRSVLPDYDWLARDWLRGWVDTLGRTIEILDDDSAWTDADRAPLAALRGPVSDIWEHRDQLLAIVDSAPRTVVHCDFWPSNLIAADDGTTVAIDWSQVGIGAIGQDLDQLALDPVWMQVLPDIELDDLEQHIVPAYRSGLRTAGVEIDELSLRRIYAAAAAVHYAPMLSLQANLATDQAAVDALEQRFGVPYPTIVANRARVVSRAVELGEWVLGIGSAP